MAESMEAKGVQGTAAAATDENTTTEKCVASLQVIEDFLENTQGIAELIPVPGLGKFVVDLEKYVLSAINSITKKEAVETVTVTTIHSVKLALLALEHPVVPISYVEPLAVELLYLLEDAKRSLDAAYLCILATLKGQEKDQVINKMAFEVDQCSVLADLFRATVEGVASIQPLVYVNNRRINNNGTDSDMSPQLWRAIEGAQATVELSKQAVAPSNEDLLKMRPTFAAKLLAQFQREIVNLARTEELRRYGEVALLSVIASSNALEACLRIAADPQGAVDELNEELDSSEDDSEDTAVNSNPPTEVKEEDLQLEDDIESQDQQQHSEPQDQSRQQEQPGQQQQQEQPMEQSQSEVQTQQPEQAQQPDGQTQQSEQAQQPEEQTQQPDQTQQLEGQTGQSEGQVQPSEKQPQPSEGQIQPEEPTHGAEVQASASEQPTEQQEEQ
ncbi:hypothetical protein BGW42_006334 [Actinomortierella wolfii]|nr:hypothetical protein BGW42_006334 [Actinomortierella wolfii]